MVAVAYLSLSGKGRGGRLFEAGRLLTFSASRMGAYSRWALMRGWALIRINIVSTFTSCTFNFGNDPTVSTVDKGLCCKPTNIGKNDIILNFVCTGFLFSFCRSVPSILSFQLIQIFFREPDVVTREELIPCCWLLVGMFQHKEPPNHRKPND